MKRLIFKGDVSLDALFSRFLDRLNVLWIPHMSGYPMDLMKPMRENDDFKGAKGQGPRVKKVKRVIFKGVVVLTHFFLYGYGRDSSGSGLLTCQGNLYNYSETMRTSKDPSGISKMANNGQKGDFQRKTEVLVHFLKFMWSSLCLIGFIRFKGTWSDM